jgi:hypothetical protein
MLLSPAPNATEEERDTYATFVLGILSSDRNTVAANLITGAFTLQQALEAWRQSADRWDKEGHVILHNIQSQAQASVINKHRQHLRRPPQYHRDSSLDAQDDEQVPFTSVDATDVDTHQGMGDSSMHHFNELGDDSSTLPNAFDYMSRPLDDNQHEYVLQALQRIPDVSYGSCAQQARPSCAITASQSSIKTTKMLLKDLSLHVPDANAIVAQRLVLLEASSPSVIRARLDVLHGTEYVPARMCDPSNIPMVKLQTPPTAQQTVKLFTLAANQAFYFLLRATTLDAVLRGEHAVQLNMILAGEPGTGKSQVIKAFTWYAFQHNATDKLLLTAHDWRAAVNISNELHPPRSTHDAFAVPVAKKGNASNSHRTRQCPAGPPIQFIDIDEAYTVSADHLYKISAAARRARGMSSEVVDPVFGGAHVSLIGDPAQHDPVLGKPMYCTDVVSGNALTGSNIYKDYFTDVVVLTEQQRTPCPKLFYYSRLFMTPQRPSRAIIATFMEDLNQRVVPDVAELAPLVPKAVVLRNACRAPINARLASLHCRHARQRPYLWRNPDTVNVGFDACDLPDEIEHILLQTPAKKVQDYPSVGYFFDGSEHLFIDNANPCLGVVHNGRCVARGILLDPREPEDTYVGPVRKLKYPPLALFVQPLKGAVPQHVWEQLQMQFPMLPPRCVPIAQSNAPKVTIDIPAAVHVDGRRVTSLEVKRKGIPLQDGYAVTDYFCQGANFKKECWLAHLNIPPDPVGINALLYLWC